MTFNELGNEIKHNSCQVAFTEFYNRYRRGVFNKALSMLKSHEDAQEACNDAFSRIWQMRDRWDAARGAFTTWAGIVSKNEIIRVYHRNNRDNSRRIGDLLTPAQVESDKITVIADTQNASALDALVISEQILKLEDALCQMPCHEARLAWILRHDEGYTYKMIGKVIRRSQTAAQKHVRHATAQIREYLTD